MNSFSLRQCFVKNKKHIYFWILLLSISLLFTIFRYKKPTPDSVNTAHLDTYIPPGYVLLPVELSNGAYLDGLLEQKGIVDLYTGDPNNKGTQKAATAVKIIRSPKNPDYFAVLVPDDKAGILIQRAKAFHAVIQNPHQNQETKIPAIYKKSQRIITIELDP